ncbi:MAG: hypothetical protein OSB00_17770, partial [Sphingomonas bacterium]|nr:hypothetical protein [Sphingomonas bacterium]
ARVKYGRDRQLNDSEIHRRTYAITAVCIRHSHSIVRRHHNFLIFLIKIFFQFSNAAAHAVKKSGC